jgi:hypothetical protein
MTTAPVLTALRTLDDDGLAEAYGTGAVTLAELEAEYARRDRAERRPARAPDQSAAAWHDAAFAQYMQAEAATNGYLLSRAGLAAVTDPFALWRGPERLAMKYASEELRSFWADNPRVTVTQYREGLAASSRSERDKRAGEEADAQPMARPVPPLPSVPSVTTPERPVIPPMTPGAIARYALALTRYADYADTLTARILAARHPDARRQS